MTAETRWGRTPRASIERECARRGKPAVVEGCRRLVGGDDVDPGLLEALAGPGARVFSSGPRREDVYWLRVWGTRGLLWVWDDSATPTIVLALGDVSWRVREMALKVVARHLLGDLLPAVVELRTDPVPRVRAAAARAVAVLTAASA